MRSLRSLPLASKCFIYISGWIHTDIKFCGSTIRVATRPAFCGRSLRRRATNSARVCNSTNQQGTCVTIICRILACRISETFKLCSMLPAHFLVEGARGRDPYLYDLPVSWACLMRPYATEMPKRAPENASHSASYRVVKRHVISANRENVLQALLPMWK